MLKVYWTIQDSTGLYLTKGQNRTLPDKNILDLTKLYRIIPDYTRLYYTLLY